jgi:predicted DNA-binding transcriptional regulator AlpA
MPRPRRDLRYLTTVQAASVLGVPKSTLLYLIKNGRCPAPLKTTTKNERFRFDWTQAVIDTARLSLLEEKG